MEERFRLIGILGWRWEFNLLSKPVNQKWCWQLTCILLRSESLVEICHAHQTHEIWPEIMDALWKRKCWMEICSKLNYRHILFIIITLYHLFFLLKFSEKSPFSSKIKISWMPKIQMIELIHSVYCWKFFFAVLRYVFITNRVEEMCRMAYFLSFIILSIEW